MTEESSERERSECGEQISPLTDLERVHGSESRARAQSACLETHCCWWIELWKLQKRPWNHSVDDQLPPGASEQQGETKETVSQLCSFSPPRFEADLYSRHLAILRATKVGRIFTFTCSLRQWDEYNTALERRARRRCASFSPSSTQAHPLLEGFGQGPEDEAIQARLGPDTAYVNATMPLRRCELRKSSVDLLDSTRRSRLEAVALPEDTPGFGAYPCTACDRHFISSEALKTHSATKPHKKRLKELKEAPFTQAEADRAVGRGVDNRQKPAKTAGPALSTSMVEA